MTDSANSPVQRVLRAWAESHLDLPGLRMEQLRASEAALGASLPKDVVDLYLRSNGMSGYDSEMVRFLPSEEWAPAVSFGSQAHLAEHSGCLVFAEFSIWAHEYGLRFRDGAVVLIYGGPPVRIADSFVAFLRMYLDEPRLLFPETP